MNLSSVQHGHPYISAMINNGSLHYDHDRDGTHTQLSAGCVSKFRNLDHDTFVSIKYVHDTLTVSTDIDNKQQFKQCFSVSGVKLPVGYFLGVSAATGDLSDTHDIISLKMFDLSTPDDVSKGTSTKLLCTEHLDLATLWFLLSITVKSVFVEYLYLCSELI
ncbi:Vesicular integral-membrane protein VIP36 [Portunus trituberculatus]|uniref:Vesicular integral-membrane protein VIP36 n=1 Tax=Portunus trituberculatus TaxID=210409 RepID=A0A5B7JDC0_PORTR|nr:Vesicular integral-membrane protein VIP36 [Portunus trituberculatus]